MASPSINFSSFFKPISSIYINIYRFSVKMLYGKLRFVLNEIHCCIISLGIPSFHVLKIMIVVCLSYLVRLHRKWGTNMFALSFFVRVLCAMFVYTPLHTKIWNKFILIVYYDIVYTVVTPEFVLLLQFHSLS